MKGILIDPTAKTVTDIEVESWEKVKEIIGCKWLEGVTIARVAAHAEQIHAEQILVNEEGLLVDEPGPFFQVGDNTPIAGKGVVLGVDYEGDVISTRLTAALVAPRISFPDVEFTGFTMSEDDAIHPILGPMHRITRTANFKPRGA